MAAYKWGLAGLAGALLVVYNGAQPDLRTMRTMEVSPQQNPTVDKKLRKERYGPSLEWLTRLMNASAASGATGLKSQDKDDELTARLDARVMSSLMVAGLASGFKSQVANLLWMKSDEYWHKGLLTRQNPLMELVVTLDPQFIEAWSTAGWHWAYNIYADIDSKYKNNPKMIRQKQDMAIETGLNYLGRGAEMNPETYRLWFEHGWTREKKAGLVDDKTVQLYSEARKQRDARTIYRDVPDKSGKTRQVGEEGIDIIGRTIAHLYESRPDLDKAQDHYALDLLKATPEERAGLDAVGRYLGQYGWGYQDIVNEYQKGDATMKEQIKRIVPDVEKMAAAHQVRLKMQTRNDQPTGAYITIEARYMPAWRQMKAGDIQGAINRLIGVMNADPRYHLQGLPRLAKVLELRGDAPVAIKGQFDQARKGEISSSQDIALRMLATLYERAVAAQKDPAKQKPLLKLAYETWYRARERNSLDFHARRQTLNYEDKYNFTTPKHIVDEIKKSRRGGEPNAAPEAPPNVQQYYQAPPAGGEHHEGEHHEGDGHNH